MQIILRHFFEEKLSAGVEMDRQRGGFTSFGDSGKEFGLLRHTFLGLFSY